MASLGGVRRGIFATNDKSSEAIAALDQASDTLVEAQGMMLKVSEGSDQVDVTEAKQLLSLTIARVAEIRLEIQAAMRACDTIAARL